MIQVLAGGIGTVVAAGTVANNIGVVNIRRQPGDGSMTVIAIGATGYVCGVLTRRRDTIVTRATGTHDLCMINRPRR